MDAAAEKPRMRVDLKTALLLLSFLGIGTISGLWTWSQRIAFFLVAPSLTQQSRADSVRTVEMIRTSVNSMGDSLNNRLNARCNRIENYITKIPAVQKAFTEEEKRKLREEREALNKAKIFPNP